MTGQRLSAREILDRLVAFPTVSRESNLDLVDWVEDYLAGFGVTAHRVYDADRRKASIYASVGPEVEGGVVLSGHTDVVPVDGQGLGDRPVHGGGAGRAALRPGHLRHEGVRRAGAGGGAARARARGEAAVADRAVL
jgi:acetylornithine deacetylase/succinyl-diaminopimelate desuccinylase-like protein